MRDKGLGGVTDCLYVVFRCDIWGRGRTNRRRCISSWRKRRVVPSRVISRDTGDCLIDRWLFSLSTSTTDMITRIPSLD